MTEQQTPYVTEREKKIAEIRAAHTKADKLCDFITNHASEGQIDDWITFLLSELERQKEETRKLREERAKLIEGLRWYADEIKYMNWPSELWINQGQRAREILKEIGIES